ncbi:hypothetical protein KUCAC02_005322 [Chaenocephalus aceratus]|uniref:Uncharacterized protein n=1 Tax=Chaenocephalus aceratus TaxID=36190 RepID=A0ACB9WP51_CHAAC|nr:hypothetical protein KUCAC02_005322 [Chaenocephalus aceratus]
MGNDISKTKGPPAQRRLSLGFFSNRRVSITQRLGHSAVFSRPVGPDGRPPDPNPLQPPDHTDTPPALISVFLPEFPQRTLPGPEHFKILGFIAKGSYGPILKVKDFFKEKTYAVKVLPKSDILKHGVLEQSKEEVIIQSNKSVQTPVLDIEEVYCHLMRKLVCDYCSTGDLYTCWLLKGQFREDEVQLFAAELGSALG